MVNVTAKTPIDGGAWTFARQPISGIDEAEIVALAAADPDVRRVLSGARLHGQFPTVRVVDAASGAWLMCWPQLVRPDGLQREFVLWLRGTFYIFSVAGRADVVAFAAGRQPTDAIAHDVREALLSAFVVHGRHGEGALDAADIHNDAVHPSFPG